MKGKQKVGTIWGTTFIRRRSALAFVESVLYAPRYTDITGGLLNHLHGGIFHRHADADL